MKIGKTAYLLAIAIALMILAVIAHKLSMVDAPYPKSKVIDSVHSTPEIRTQITSEKSKSNTETFPLLAKNSNGWQQPGSDYLQERDYYALFSKLRLKADPESLAISAGLLRRCTKVGSSRLSINEFEIKSREFIQKIANPADAALRTAALDEVVKHCGGFRGMT